MPYIGKSPSFGVRNRFIFTPDAGATSVSSTDDNGSTLTFTDGAFVDVYLNGVLLKAGTDYNTNTANTIAGLTATVANDEVTVIVYDVFAVGDTVSAVNGGTFSGGVTFNGAFTSLGIDDNADATSITIDSSERVGIGTTSPSDTLHVKGLAQIESNAGDAAYLRFDNDVNSGGKIWRAGAGVSAHGTFSIYNQTDNKFGINVDTNGHVTMPNQSAFSVTANQQNNLAINTTTTIQFANEIFDQNADFDHTNYTFTAPVTGKYMLNVNLRMDNVDIAHTYMYMILATSNREYEWLLDISEYQNDLDYLPFTINVLADMDASDTAQVKMHIPNAGAAQSDVVGSNKTTFSGFLAC